MDLGVAGLSTLPRRLHRVSTEETVVRRLVDGVSDTAGIAAAVYRAADDQSLRPAARSSAIGDLALIDPEHGSSVRRAFREETPVPLPSLDAALLVGNDRPTDGVAIPLGSHGVLVVLSVTELFDESTMVVLQLVAAYAEATLDGVAYRRDRDRLERSLRQQTDRHEHLAQINEKVRKMDQALIQADSRAEIERVVCDRLLTSDRFAFVWIGELDRDGRILEPRRHAGAGDGYLEEVSLKWAEGDRSALPACRTAAEGDVTVDSNVATEHDAAWRKPAINRGFRSVASIPLSYEGIVYGVVSVYADQPFAFNELALSVLIEMGETIGYAINAAEAKNTLTSDDEAEIRFRIDDATGPFFALADRLESRLDVKSVAARSDEMSIAYVDIPAEVPEQVRREGAAIDMIERVQMTGDADDCLYEIIVNGPCLPVSLADLGSKPRSVTVTSDCGYVTATVPPETDSSSFVKRVRTVYPTADPVAHIGDRTTTTDERYVRHDPLTDRQREVLEAAYFSGFFEWPRDMTGEEIAETLDISQPSFLQHLRMAERKLVGGLCEGSRNR